MDPHDRLVMTGGLVKTSRFRFESFGLLSMVNPDGMLEDDDIPSAYQCGSQYSSDARTNSLDVLPNDS